MTTPYDEFMEGLIEAMAAALCKCGHRYNQHDPEDAQCDAPGPQPTWGACPCRCFRSPDPNRTTLEYLFTAALAYRSTEGPQRLLIGEQVGVVETNSPKDGFVHVLAARSRPGFAWPHYDSPVYIEVLAPEEEK